MLRMILAGLALACCAAPVVGDPTSPVDDNANGPMRFQWRQEKSDCGAQCRSWISASGYITSETPRDFETFAQDPNVHGAVIVFDSDGGSVLGAIALGRSIRRLDMITTVGKTTLVPRDPQQHATLTGDGRCESMCAFLLLAGKQRYVPPQAQVLVHQIWLGKKRKQALEANYSADELNVVQRDIGRLAQYTIEMGGGIDLLETALRIPPWEPLYKLSRDELDRMGLNTVPTLFTQSEPAMTPPATTTALTTVGQPGTPRE
jgi:hypothetical protein